MDHPYSFFENGNKTKDRCDGSGNEFVQPGEKDTYVQLVISLALGSTAFFAFCVGLSFSFLPSFLVASLFSLSLSCTEKELLPLSVQTLANR